ncbi:hypothetical protein [Bacteroides xylanisolvens]|nr:hypothetical protein [Bacteroides xylanisolvens]MDB0718351.1 hypothetical protein [Bacteroides xylanisolvens]
MEKPFGFSDAVASGSIKRISSFFFIQLKVCYRLMGAQFENFGDFSG